MTRVGLMLFLGRSTVGLVLDGTTVTLVVPGSPSSKIREDGRKIEPGDVVTHIDGLPVEKHVGVRNRILCLQLIAGASLSLRMVT
jgi:C-terminal processing protease CtpA/Prc